MKHRLTIKKLSQPVRIRASLILWTCLFFLFLFFHSCIEETIIPTKDSYTISLGTTFDGLADEDAGSPEDSQVNAFRILIFDSSEACIENIYIADITANNPVQLSLETGTYDFVFIGNEDSDTSLSSILSNFDTNNKTLSDLATLSFASSAFGSSIRIPMSHIQRNVEIGNDKYTIDGVEYPNTTVWKVPLRRLAIRMDLHIKTTSAVKQQSFSSLEIYNLPKNVPILETDNSDNTIYNGGAANYETTPRIFNASSSDNGGFQSTADGYEWILTRVILPSNLFTPDSGNEAITLKANYSDRESETAILKAGDELGHQAPRNTYFLVNATILPASMEVEMKVEDWEEFLYNNHLVTKVRLNLSDIHLHVTEYNRGKVLFTCNQPEVFIEELTTDGDSVDNIFYGLVGNDAYNFHYEYDEITERGNGYFDLTVDRIKPLLQEKQQKNVSLVVNASGVKRTVNVNLTIAPILFAKYDYVGAFWRNDQMGERIISMKGAGYWTVEVIEGDDWIVLDDKKSLDPNLFTENPGDAELYPVDSERVSLSGYNNVFFRIGLTGVNPGTSPRYGVIKIYREGGIYDYSVNLYVRQGEEADYLMRPEDTKTNGDWLGANGSTVPRPLAGRFSPFNLTAQDYLDNTNTGGAKMDTFPQLTYKGGVFTEYPTQAGALFTFAAYTYPRVAIHPFNSSGNLTGWESGASNLLWDALEPIHETCPPGYRRMSSGKIGDRYTNYTPVNVSEMKQSLFVNPVDQNISNNVENNMFGYYADGFFDRRFIEDAGGLNAHLEDVAAAANSNGIAYAGRLFYNPNNNASLFFPAAGQRLENSSYGSRGRLVYAGYIGHYWTSTPGSSSAHSLDISNDRGLNAAGTGSSLSRANAYCIRCVKDE